MSGSGRWTSTLGAVLALVLVLLVAPAASAADPQSSTPVCERVSRVRDLGPFPAEPVLAAYGYLGAARADFLRQLGE
jgi:hypothetical protein